jgi:iron(III) transport system ATP-binding protein
VSRLVLTEVSRRFDAVTAVDRFSLTLASGEFVSLLGPSGCGKTTTLRMIAGFLAPSEGTIEMDGRLISSPASTLPPEKRGMSMIFQSYAIWPNMTVEENVAFGLEVRRLPKSQIAVKVHRILDVVQMRHLGGRYPQELSGGQQQRVALARAIVVQPTVLLLDEPLSNLDANLRLQMRIEIKELQRRLGFTAVYVTHDQTEAMAIADRIAIMDGGVLRQVGSPRDIYARPRTRFVAGFIGRTNLLDGLVRDAEVAFDHFAIPRGRFPEAAALEGQVSFSLRPQSILLHRQPPPASDGAAVIAGQVVQRAYLGEHWDYTVRPVGGALALRVTARPHEVFEVDEKVWLELDPRQMARLQPE